MLVGRNGALNGALVTVICVTEVGRSGAEGGTSSSRFLAVNGGPWVVLLVKRCGVLVSDRAVTVKVFVEGTAIEIDDTTVVTVLATLMDDFSASTSRLLPPGQLQVNSGFCRRQNSRTASESAQSRLGLKQFMPQS